MQIAALWVALHPSMAERVTHEQCINLKGLILSTAARQMKHQIAPYKGDDVEPYTIRLSNHKSKPRPAQ